ncbi:hypothetical protein BGZ96_006507 [Linnemannia gamsii]|uniref:Uncharacterized protein n=1 Tax=Linnemannia gamsii TaxID=64522 RepID=A0ABQ7K382_9FUNG|nr:hypothetical protein BGZ96_006507 [Linnemannia gamsii]
MAIHVWSAGASLAGFATWTTVSNRGIVTKYLDVDVHIDGAGSGTGAESEQQHQRLLNEEVVDLTVNKKEEKKEQEREHTGQESCEKEVHTEDLSEIGQEIAGAQQIVTKAPSLKELRRSVTCRQDADRSFYNRGSSDAITTKRHRRGPPTTTAHKTWKTSVSLLQQVKHDIQIWSFSLWVLAPIIPRPFNQRHHQRLHQQPKQQYHSTDGLRSQERRHAQLYGPVEIKDGKGLMLTMTSSVLHEDMEESEYDLVLSEGASEFNRDLADSVVVVTTKAEGEEGRRRSQDGRDGGNQVPIQDDGKTGNRSVLLLTEDCPPSFGQMKYRPSSRTGYMSQSMPDLHAIKRTIEFNPVESMLARWSRMTLDSERLGGIFQYYLRQRASTLKKEKHTSGYDDDDQDSAASDDPQGDTSSHTDDHNDGDDDEADPGVTFVIRSSTLPTVRVGLYGADQKRFWTSSGSVHLSPLPEEPVVAHRKGDDA